MSLVAVPVFLSISGLAFRFISSNGKTDLHIALEKVSPFRIGFILQRDSDMLRPFNRVIRDGGFESEIWGIRFDFE